MNSLKSFVLRLTSRKFLLTVGAALILIANERWAELVVLISGYMGIEGIGDAADRVATQKTKQVELTNAVASQRARNGEIEFTGNDEDLDTSTIVAGDAPL